MRYGLLPGAGAEPRCSSEESSGRTWDRTRDLSSVKYREDGGGRGIPDLQHKRLMELAGLEPATSWVRSRIARLRPEPALPGKSLVAGLSFTASPGPIIVFHPPARMAGLHMGCKRPVVVVLQTFSNARPPT